MKRQLTAEQIAKRDAKRAAFKQLIKRIADMDDGAKIRLAENYGARKIDGASYSPCNSMLLALQLPQATIVAGFKSWLKAGRCVRKGEHGASIWVPIGYGKDKHESAVSGFDVTTTAEPTGFVLGTVFDIAQTCELRATPVDDVPESNAGQRANVLAMANE